MEIIKCHPKKYKFPYRVYCFTPPRSEVHSKMEEWLLNNLSKKAGLPEKEYRYIYLKDLVSYGLNSKIGVAFRTEESVTVFKLRWF